MKKTEMVIKAHEIIHIPHKVSLIQQQLWSILISKAWPDLGNLAITEHQVSYRDVMGYWSYKTENYHVFKEAIETLVSTTVRYRILGDHGEGWGVYGLLAQGELKNGVFTYAFAPKLREQMKEPERYAKINLLIQQRFSSKYALAVYELCISYVGVEQTPWYNLDTFRWFVGLEEGEYSEYRDLNKRILQTAIAEINKQSDIRVSIETKKTGRKITHLKFQMEKKKGFQLEMPLFEKIRKSAKQTEKLDYTQHPLYQKLCAYPRFTAQEAIQLLQAWPEMEVYKACKYVDGYLEPIKSYPAFLKKCLEQGWYHQNDFPLSKAWWDALDQNKRSGLYMKDYKVKHPNLDAANPEFQSWLMDLWQQHLIQTEFPFS